MPYRAICFVIMPFGRKPDASGREIDFDVIYKDIIEPSIRDVGFDSVRADEEVNAGIITRRCSSGSRSANTPSPI